jgi:hypothetical protein
MKLTRLQRMQRSASDNSKAKPGDILRYCSRPRHKGEILCHNHVAHHEASKHGENGFRYFVVARGSEWKLCPCGWRPELGKHYALPDHVEWQRRRIARGEKMKAYDDAAGKLLI